MKYADVLKGPFWVICRTNGEELLFDGLSLISYPVPYTTIPTPSHINVWREVCGNHKRLAWNYYPRGRVEIRRGKAVVYANPICFQYDNLEEELRTNFNLGEIEIVYKADNSKHYANGVCEY